MSADGWPYPQHCSPFHPATDDTVPPCRVRTGDAHVVGTRAVAYCGMD